MARRQKCWRIWSWNDRIRLGSQRVHFRFGRTVNQILFPQKLERPTGIRYPIAMMRNVLFSRVVPAMKKLCPLLLMGLVLFTGCAHNYTMTLTNGTQLGAKGKPKLKEGVYYFTDASGNETSMPAGRVSQIEPASSAAKSKKTGFIDAPKK
jgi:hypothetical protein